MNAARVFDLPGWNSPARVGNIPDLAGSYGWVLAEHVGIDEDGGLWVAADVTPVASIPGRNSLHVYVEWAEGGLALHVPRKGYGRIGDGVGASGGTYLRPDRVPVVRVLPDLPAHAVVEEV